MNTQSYLPYMHWLLALPVIFGLGYALMPIGDEGASSLAINLLFWLSAFIALIAVYVYQWKFLRHNYSNRLIWQAVFIGAAFVLPALATIVGDRAGIVAFNDEDSAGTGILLASQGVAIAVGTFAVFLCALGNIIFIITKGQSIVVKVFGYIIRGLAWGLIFLISAFAYSIAYSAHDPNSE